MNEITPAEHYPVAEQNAGGRIFADIPADASESDDSIIYSRFQHL